jgi:hypothetical protein
MVEGNGNEKENPFAISDYSPPYPSIYKRNSSAVERSNTLSLYCGEGVFYA